MRIARTTAVYVLLVAIAATTLLPLIWMVFTSLHPPMDPPPTMQKLFSPDEWHPDNYGFVLTYPELPISRFALNSAIVTLGVVVLQLALCSLAAFAFARLTFRGRNLLFVCFLATMMVPAPASTRPE